MNRQFDWLLAGSWLLILGFCVACLSGVGLLIGWLALSGHVDTIRRAINEGGRSYRTRSKGRLALEALEALIVEQADRIAWLEGEVAGWRIKNQQLRDALEAIVALYDRPETGRRKTAAMIARAALDGAAQESNN